MLYNVFLFWGGGKKIGAITMNSKILYSLSVIFYHCTAHCTHCSLKKPTDKLKKTNWQTDRMRWRSLTRQFLYEGCQKSSKCFRFHITAIPCSGIFVCANWSPIHSAKSWQRSPSESQLHSRLCAHSVCAHKSCYWNLHARICLDFLARVLSPLTLLSCSMPKMSYFEFSIQEHWQALV